jgi:hypothetical protein
LKGISNNENSSEGDDDNDEDSTTDYDASITNDDEVRLFQRVMSEKDDPIELTDALQSLIA